jgi:hypothetical protein
MRPLFTVKSLAAVFRRHENTIYRWLLEDHLFPNAFKVKDGWYVPESDVRRVMRDGRAAANVCHRAD